MLAYRPRLALLTHAVLPLAPECPLVSTSLAALLALPVLLVPSCVVPAAEPYVLPRRSPSRTLRTASTPLWRFAIQHPRLHALVRHGPRRLALVCMRSRMSLCHPALLKHDAALSFPVPFNPPVTTALHFSVKHSTTFLSVSPPLH
jgi:hypothetical protein